MVQWMEVLKDDIVHYVKSMTKETGIRVGFSEIRERVRLGISIVYVWEEINNAVTELKRERRLEHDIETIPGGHSKGGAMFEETYWLKGAECRQKYEKPAA